MPAHIIGELQFGLASVCLVCPFTENKYTLCSNRRSGIKLRCSHPRGFFPAFLIQKQEKKSLLWERLWNYLRFLLQCLYSLKFLFPLVLQDLSVSVIPKGNINSENRFPNLCKQLLSWKWRQPWMKYKWETEQGRDGELHLAILASAVWSTGIRVRWEKKSIVLAKSVPQNFWAKIIDWTTHFGNK